LLLLLIVLFMRLATCQSGARRKTSLVGAGAIFGISLLVHFRTVWVLPILVWVLIVEKKGGLRFFLSGLLAPLVLFSARNLLVLGDAAPWPKGALLTIWIGNNPQATGGYIDPPPIPGGWGAPDAWVRGAVNFAIFDPSQVIKLSLTKLQRLTYPIEYLAFLREYPRVAILVILISWAWGFFVIALLLVFLSGRLWRVDKQLRDFDLFASVSVIYLLSNIPLIVEPRYRVAVDPLLVIVAVGTLQVLKARRATS
jgi:hypothetical protein